MRRILEGSECFFKTHIKVLETSRLFWKGSARFGKLLNIPGNFRKSWTALGRVLEGLNAFSKLMEVVEAFKIFNVALEGSARFQKLLNILGSFRNTLNVLGEILEGYKCVFKTYRSSGSFQNLPDCFGKFLEGSARFEFDK